MDTLEMCIIDRMGSGWHEWPLMIFTVFGHCVAGGFIVLALALLKGDLRAEAQQRVIAVSYTHLDDALLF